MSTVSEVENVKKPSGEPSRTPESFVGPNKKLAYRSWVTFSLFVAATIISSVAIFLPLKTEAIGIAAIVSMVMLIFLRLPVAVAMIVPSMAAMYSMRGPKVVETIFATVPYDEVASWTLSVLPMFILMGLFLWKSGLTESLYGAGRQWLGWLPGGLAAGTNLAGAGLGAVSGSTTGTVYALARIGVPEMLKAGYSKHLAVGAVLVASLPGQLIPPSILMVLYAGIAEVPVGKQLMAGIGPGLLVMVMFTIMIVVFAKFGKGVDPSAADPSSIVKTSWRGRFDSLVKIWPVPLIVFIITYGMFSGLFTATEAGAVAALASMVVLLIWKRKGGAWAAVSEASLGAVATVGAIFMLLVGVAILSRMMTLTGISNGFADLVADMNLGRVQFLLMMMVVYLFLGAFMDSLAMMVLTVPILIPTLAALDISMLWYGAFVVFMCELAVISPPVGILSMIVHSLVKDPKVNLGTPISLKDVFVAAGWFLPMAVIVILILIFFPEIATFLPDRGAG
jgi:tripartite ATP-independent transporter DctM subunit